MSPEFDKALVDYIRNPVPSFYALLTQAVEKMNTEAYNRGLDEGMKATDPEVLYGRMLAEEERNKVPAPIWG